MKIAILTEDENSIVTILNLSDLDRELLQFLHILYQDQNAMEAVLKYTINHLDLLRQKEIKKVNDHDSLFRILACLVSDKQTKKMLKNQNISKTILELINNVYSEFAQSRMSKGEKKLLEILKSNITTEEP